MKRLKDKLDPTYTKIAIYASLTVITTVVIIMLLYGTKGVWIKVWKLVSSVLKPVVIGCVLCYLLEPMVGFFDDIIQNKRKKEKTSRVISVIISFIIVLGGIGVILTMIIWSMTKQLTQIDYNTIIKLFEDTQNDAMGLFNQVQGYLKQYNIDIALMGRKIPGLVGAVASAVSSIFFGIVFAIYFLTDGKRISKYWKNVAHIILSDRAIALIKETGKELDICFSGYIRGQAIDAVIVGTVSSIALNLVSHPYALLIGLIIGIGNLIPYVGPILGYVAVVIINVTSLDIQMLVVGIVIISIVMFIDSNIINPKLLSGTIKVHPLLVIASLLAGGGLGGIAGMIIAVPTGAFIKMQFDKWVESKK